MWKSSRLAPQWIIRLWRSKTTRKSRNWTSRIWTDQSKSPRPLSGWFAVGARYLKKTHSPQRNAMPYNKHTNYENALRPTTYALRLSRGEAPTIAGFPPSSSSWQSLRPLAPALYPYPKWTKWKEYAFTLYTCCMLAPPLHTTSMDEQTIALPLGALHH